MAHGKAVKFIVPGVIAPNGSNEAIAGQETYLVGTSSDWFAWDGERSDHASTFATAELALAAARSCRGPIFRMPERTSIHAVRVDDWIDAT